MRYSIGIDKFRVKPDSLYLSEYESMITIGIGPFYRHPDLAAGQTVR